MVIIQILLHVGAVISISKAHRSVLGDFTHSSMLDDDGRFHLCWKIDNDTITFEMTAKTQAWIGLGFSSNGKMAGSDFVIAGMDGLDGFVSDRHLNSDDVNGYPIVDQSQDYEFLAGSKNCSHISIMISRKLKTCDPNDWQITHDTVRVLWAFDDRITKTQEEVKFRQHREGNRGYKSLRLLDEHRPSSLETMFENSDIVKVELKVKNVELRPQTTQWCQVFEFELPDWSKHHLIAYETAIESGNKQYIHHMILYKCDQNMSDLLEKPFQWWNSLDVHDIDPTKLCSTVITVWASGGKPFIYPNNTGLPFFNDQNPYVLLVIHYENTDFVEDITDSSGFRFYFTAHLRPWETGMVVLGVEPSMVMQIIPPGQSTFTTYAYCTSECTSEFRKPIHVFSALLHSHKFGKAIRVRHIRQSVELEPIIEDMHYDSKFQNEISFDKQKVIEQGDEIILECIYDTIKTNGTTLGGDSSDNERCTVFLQYYPRNATELWSCMSTPDFRGVATLLHINHIQGSASKVAYGHDESPIIELGNETVNFEQFMETEVKWCEKNLHKEFQKLIRDEPHFQVCSFRMNSETEYKKRNKGFIENGPYVSEPYERLDICNKKASTLVMSVYVLAMLYCLNCF